MSLFKLIIEIETLDRPFFFVISKLDKQSYSEENYWFIQIFYSYNHPVIIAVEDLYEIHKMVASNAIGLFELNMEDISYEYNLRCVGVAYRLT